MLAEGTVLGELYQIVRSIGQGGMGVIYLAYHLRLRKYVVIKMIKENFVGNVNVRGEVDLLKKLHHPCLPQVYDFVQVGTQIYTVMDYIDGTDLDKYFENGNLITNDDIEKWLGQLCDVLVYLHKQKPAIIHSDIKPQNIIIDRDGNANLIDFNISFEEDSSNLLGLSKEYASYEQLEAANLIRNGYGCPEGLIDATTDVYSLGATFYYILTGMKPYAGIIEQYPLTSLELYCSPGIAAIVQKAMQRDKKKRYSSSARMLADINNLKKKTWQYRLKMTGIAGGSVAVIALAGCIAVSVYSGINNRKKAAYLSELEKMLNQNCYTYDEEKSIYEFLNNDEYEKYLKKDNENKAQLIYKAGNYYFINEDYANAASYFDEARKIDSENADYWRDYAICLARQGKNQEAASVLAEAQGAGIESNSLEIVQAEIYMSEGKYQEAVNNAKKVLSSQISSQLFSRAINLMTASYWKLGQYSECIDILNSQVKQKTTEETHDIYYKAVMDSYLRMAQANSNNNSMRQSSYINAQNAYAQINDKSMCTLTDNINVAISYEDIGRYDNAIAILNSQINGNSQDYRIYMQLSYCYYYQAKAGKGDYSKAKEYYSQAQALYKTEQASGKSDSKMDKLTNIIGGVN